jgi:hypothetical protein
VLYRCQLYEHLLTANETSQQARRNLRHALIELYIVILSFLATAIRVYEKNSIQRTFAAWTSDDLLRFEKDCQGREIDAETEARNCDRSAFSEIVKVLQSLPTIQDLADSIDSKVALTWELLQEKEMGDILAWVSGIPYEDHHKAACKDRTKNTGGWIFQDKRYQEWYTSQDSAILWLHGIRKSLRLLGTTYPVACVDKYQLDN